MSRRVILFAIAAGVAFGQPVIYPRGILNAASFAPAGLANGGIARGSIFNIFGEKLGPATLVSSSGFPVAATLSGVSIKVIQGATSLDVLPLYVSATQIAAVMPSNAPLGNASLRVTYNNQSSPLTTVRIAASSFGAFSALSNGTGPGAIQNALASGVPVNTLTNPAVRGGTIIVYGTGLGAIATPDNLAPGAGNLSANVEAWVGGISAPVSYKGRSPCCAGLDQVNIVIPDTAPTGCWVPVYLRVDGITSNAVTIAIGTSGAACSDATNPLSGKFASGGNLGTVRLFRSNVRHDIAVSNPGELSEDVFQSTFAKVTGGPFAYSPLFSMPPAGSCMTFSFAGDFFGDEGKIPVASTKAKSLNAGASFSLTGGASPVALTPGVSDLGAFASLIQGLPNQLKLTPGSAYTITSAGGADVQAFNAALTLPAPFTWTNRQSITSLDRTTPLTLSWTGLPAGQSMAILGGNVDLPTNSSALFYCLAPRDAASFTIPTAILGALPPTRANLLQSKGVIYLMTPTPANAQSFSAPGLDGGFAVAGHVMGKTVGFR